METIEEEEQVEIRLMDDLDYEDATKFMLELCEIAGSKFDEERWENAFSRRVSNPDRYCCFIARRGDKPVGMLFAETNGEIGQITNLYVIPEERYSEIVGPMRIPMKEKGLADTMMETAFDFLREHGCKEAWINLKKGVKPAEIVYSRFGFVEKFTVLSKKL
nr:GNAT family N-acetyltransferase [Candidatus Freyarchaeota archaeon]